MCHPPRGVAASDFRPLCNIPHCCLPQESGPCLSSSVADHPLRSATDRRLGRLLPHQQANQTQAHPCPHDFDTVPMPGLYFIRYQHTFRCVIPVTRADYPRVTHPSAANLLFNTQGSIPVRGCVSTFGECEFLLPLKTKVEIHNYAGAFYIKLSVLNNKSARLACVKHAASVHPEPGSNS